MRPALILTFLLISSQFLSAQDRYMVSFCEKTESARISASTVALSSDALERRARYGVSLDETDLPVDRSAIAALSTIPGIEITGKSRWFNAAFVSTDGKPETILAASLLDGVCSVEPLRTYSYQVEEVSDEISSEVVWKNPLPIARTQDFVLSPDLIDFEAFYGFAYNQAEMLRVPFLFKQGFDGNGIRIGVFDSGFKGADTIEPFRFLWENDRILDYWNFHEQDDSVFDKGSHGTWVTSCIATYSPSSFVGTAPGASFYLYRTEVGEFERVVEEEYWVMAAERADSLGVDVINTSLGYYTFDPEDSLFDHSYNDLDGNTTIITQGANMAAEKGIMVVVSAGNQGNNAWRFIGAPADAFKALTVGSVDAERKRSDFSSYGPSADGRVKPEVLAQGSAPYVIATTGQVGQAFGTSFSSPITAGAVASLRQAFPEATVDELRSAIIRSASHWQNPTDSLGYGIPNFEIAYRLLAGPEDLSEIQDLWGAPNPTSGKLAVWLMTERIGGEEATMVLTDLSGRIIREWTIGFGEELLQMETFDFFELAAGTYILHLSTDEGEERAFKFVKE